MQSTANQLLSSSKLLAQLARLNLTREQLLFYYPFPEFRDLLNKANHTIQEILEHLQQLTFIKYKPKAPVLKFQNILDQLLDKTRFALNHSQNNNLSQQIRPQDSYKITPYAHSNISANDYKQSIDLLQFNWSLEQPQKIQPPAKIDFTFVNNQTQLRQCISHLLSKKIVAIDVEHSTRSYCGFTCLIQISSEQQNFIIDPFPLWQFLNQLNQVTANSLIIKVLHGCSYDVKWLKRDFGLYLINIYDTYQAGKILNFNHLSYAYIVKQCLGIQLDKKYQTADWRVRPLPQQMLSYAVKDTHYLISVMSQLNIKLFGLSKQIFKSYEELLLIIFIRCKQVSKYEAEQACLENDESYKRAYRKNQGKNWKRLQKLLRWRDQQARKLDQNSVVTMPNKILFILNDKYQLSEFDLKKLLRKSNVKVGFEQLFELMNQLNRQYPRPFQQIILKEQTGRMSQEKKEDLSYEFNRIEGIKLETSNLKKTFPELEQKPQELFYCPLYLMFHNANLIEKKKNKAGQKSVQIENTQVKQDLLENQQEVIMFKESSKYKKRRNKKSSLRQSKFRQNLNNSNVFRYLQ